jgi:hypothetical protein
MVKKFKIASALGEEMPADHPSSMELPDSLDQISFGGLADRSFNLSWVEVTNKIRPSAGTKLDEVSVFSFHVCFVCFLLI